MRLSGLVETGFCQCNAFTTSCTVH